MCLYVYQIYFPHSNEGPLSCNFFFLCKSGSSANSCNLFCIFCSKTLKAFRAGEINVLVSSDAMTRGMDVEGVTNVINYDMPAYIKTYIHRAGRTARAGQSGRCITLLKKDEVWTFFCFHLSFSAFVSLEKISVYL